jgi:cytochrome b6-f complex subunit 4
MIFTCSQFVFSVLLLYWLAVLDPAAMGTNKPFATPLEILQNGISTQFSNFTYSSNKLLGVLAMATVPAGLITIPFIESINIQNPYRRQLLLFLLGTLAAVWLGIGDISLTLVYFSFKH